MLKVMMNGKTSYSETDLNLVCKIEVLYLSLLKNLQNLNIKTYK